MPYLGEDHGDDVDDFHTRPPLGQPDDVSSDLEENDVTVENTECHLGGKFYN